MGGPHHVQRLEHHAVLQEKRHLFQTTERTLFAGEPSQTLPPSTPAPASHRRPFHAGRRRHFPLGYKGYSAASTAQFRTIHAPTPSTRLAVRLTMICPIRSGQRRAWPRADIRSDSPARFVPGQSESSPVPRETFAPPAGQQSPPGFEPVCILLPSPSHQLNSSAHSFRVQVKQSLPCVFLSPEVSGQSAQP